MMVVLMPLTLVALALPLDAVPAAFKCPAEYHTVRGYLTIVDDVVVRDYRGTGRDSAEAVLPDRDDLLSVEIRCLTLRGPEPGDPPTLRTAVVVLTKSGAPAVFEAQLAALVEEQRLHREHTGRYAATLTELNFFAGRTIIPIELTVDGDGWSAAVRMNGVPTTCRVAVGPAATSAPELRAGIPRCEPNARP
jgi:hypothetical protein